MSGVDDRVNDPVSRVADPRIASVADQSYAKSIVQEPQDAISRDLFVVFVVGEQGSGLGNVVMMEEYSGPSGIFAGQGVDLTEDALSPVREIFEVPDGCGD